MKRSTFTLILLIQIFCYYYGINGQKCLNQFLTTDYHFIPIHPSLRVAQCVAGGSQRRKEFYQNCPGSDVVLTENYRLKVISEILPEDHPMLYLNYTYNENRNKTWFSKQEINIYEQLTIDLKKCNADLLWGSIILQVIHLDKDTMEYGFLLMKQRFINAKVPIVLFGYIMVPYKAFPQTVVLNKRQYENAIRNATSLVDKLSINSLLICDLDSLWKEACVGSEETTTQNAKTDEPATPENVTDQPENHPKKQDEKPSEPENKGPRMVSDMVLMILLWAVVPFFTLF